MPFTTNSNNKYTVSIIADNTGGDSIPTLSGYESVYVMEIIPNPGEVIIAGDLTIDSNAFQPGVPPQPSLHSITPVNGLFQLQEYFMPNPAGHPEIDVIGLYEVYLDDNGYEWDYTQGPQPSITTNTNPVKLKLYIALSTTFTSTIPFANTSILLDIDLASPTPIYGCTDPTQFNYDPLANTDDGSCTPIVIGCMDATSDTYDATANTNDATLCEYWGCIDSAATNYSTNYTHDCGGNLTSIDTTCCQYTGACNTPINLTSGAISLNYDSPNNVDCSGMPGSADDSCCHWAVVDCLDNTALNYNYNVANNTVNGTVFNVDCSGVVNPTSGSEDYNCCNYITNSCTDPVADNYDSAATHDCNGDDITDIAYTQAFGWDSCCTYTIDGCMDYTGGLFNTYINPSGGSLNIPWINYDSDSFCTDGFAPTTNLVTGVVGCYNNNGYLYENYNPNATVQNTVNCERGGCIDHGSLSVSLYGDPYDSPDPGNAAYNYDINATYDDGNCFYFGCMDPISNNYASYATGDSVLTTTLEVINAVRPPYTSPPIPTYDPVNGIVGDCAGGYILGCMNDNTASNYDATANVDDGSCCVDGCMDPLANNYDATATCDDGTYCTYTTAIPGCMDSDAANYNPSATVDDGSCEYDACINSVLNFNGLYAATNYAEDCNGTDRTGSLGAQTECDTLTGYPFGFQLANRDCHFQCASFTTTVDTSTGIVTLNIDQSAMPDINYGNKARIRMRYAEAGSQLSGPGNNAFGYSFDIGMVNASIELVYNPASGWSITNGGYFITNIQGNNVYNYNTPMQNITFANTPNEIDYQINHTCWAGGTQGDIAYGWYWNPPTPPSINNRRNVCQTVSFQGSGGVYGCTDSNSSNYESTATIDDGSCITCGCCNSWTLTNAFDYTDGCKPRLRITIDNSEVDPSCIPCEFPTSVDLEVSDPNDVNFSQTYTVPTPQFYGGFGLSYNSVPPGTLYVGTFGNFPGSALQLGVPGQANINFGLPQTIIQSTPQNPNALPMAFTYVLSDQGGGVAVNTDSSVGIGYNDYDIDGKQYQVTMNIPNTCGSIQGSTATASFTPGSGCGINGAINYDSTQLCGTTGCYFCPGSTNSLATPLNTVVEPDAEVWLAHDGSNNGWNGSMPQLYIEHDANGGANSAVTPDTYLITASNPIGHSSITWSQSSASSWDAEVASHTYLPPSVYGLNVMNLASIWFGGGFFGPSTIADLDPSVIDPATGIQNSMASTDITFTYEWFDINGSVACTIVDSNVITIDFWFGCIDSTAFNYEPNATIDNGSCIPYVYGCTCISAINYFAGANTDDGSCIYVGCTSTDPGPNPDINGFCSDAVFDSSIYTCGNSLAAYTSYGTYYEYDSNGIYIGQTSTPQTGIPQTSLNTGHACGNFNAGLANIGYNAINHDPLANVDDGSCII